MVSEILTAAKSLGERHRRQGRVCETPWTVKVAGNAAVHAYRSAWREDGIPCDCPHCLEANEMAIAEVLGLIS